jgi:hypothetical protein
VTWLTFGVRHSLGDAGRGVGGDTRAVVPVVRRRVLDGDVLPGGTTVVSLQRDPAADRVVLGTDDGAQRMLCREDSLLVAYRAPPEEAPGERVRGWAAGVWLMRRATRPAKSGRSQGSADITARGRG